MPIAERCFAALGDVSKARALNTINDLAARAEQVVPSTHHPLSRCAGFLTPLLASQDATSALCSSRIDGQKREKHVRVYEDAGLGTGIASFPPPFVGAVVISSFWQLLIIRIKHQGSQVI